LGNRPTDHTVNGYVMNKQLANFENDVLFILDFFCLFQIRRSYQSISVISCSYVIIAPRSYITIRGIISISYRNM
jgi:hypothetical protein